MFYVGLQLGVSPGNLHLSYSHTTSSFCCFKSSDSTIHPWAPKPHPAGFLVDSKLGLFDDV